MIYRFKMVSDEVENFSREYTIDADNTFLDLRNAILDSVGYSKDNIDSFFICERDWSRHEEITLEDMGSSSDMDTYLMKETPLSDLVEDEGQRLMFVFDYLTDRGFFLELKETIPGEYQDEPKCVRKSGNAPAQSVDLDEFEQKLDAAAVVTGDLGTDIFGDDFGDDLYNDDDLSGLENIGSDQL
ncbi:MAG: hypothetical protein HDS43_03030 [Bacteroides sp.]|nr:hypothetical protein [Bacteroides sp.]